MITTGKTVRDFDFNLEKENMDLQSTLEALEECADPRVGVVY